MAESTVSDTLDRLDSLQQKLAQLDAMLHMAYGNAGEAFRGMNDDLQDKYIWACSTLAGECHQLADGLSLADFNPHSVLKQKPEASHA